MTERQEVRTPVLIVGGGITGLTTALLLARQHVPCILVEQHPTVSLLPQARAFNPRSIEIYRSQGLEHRIRRRLSRLVALPEMIGAETLVGEERFRMDLFAHVRPPEATTPSEWAMIDQDELERVVRDAAEDEGADIRFGTEMVRFEDDGDGDPPDRSFPLPPHEAANARTPASARMSPTMRRPIRAMSPTAHATRPSLTGPIEPSAAPPGLGASSIACR